MWFSVSMRRHAPRNLFLCKLECPLSQSGTASAGWLCLKGNGSDGASPSSWQDAKRDA